jgi:hypothetical protein
LRNSLKQVLLVCGQFYRSMQIRRPWNPPRRRSAIRGKAAVDGAVFTISKGSRVIALTLPDEVLGWHYNLPLLP